MVQNIILIAMIAASGKKIDLGIRLHTSMILRKDYLPFETILADIL